MRILVPIEDLEPVPAKTWPGPQTPPKPPAPPPAPVQPKKPPPPSQRPAPRPSAPKRQPTPAHPTAAVAKTTIEKRARVTDVSSGTGYDIATGARLAEAKVASTMPTGMKFLASAPLPVNLDKKAPTIVHGSSSGVDEKKVLAIVTGIGVVSEGIALLTVEIPPVSAFFGGVALGAQVISTGIQVDVVRRDPSPANIAGVVVDTALLGASLKIPATAHGKRVIIYAGSLSPLAATVEKEKSPKPPSSTPSLRPGRR